MVWSHLLAAKVSGQLQPDAVDGQVSPGVGSHNCVPLHDPPYVLYVSLKKIFLIFSLILKN